MRLLTLGGLFVFSIVSAAAFQLQPMSATIDPTAGGTTSFEVRNTTEAPIAVQMRVTTRRILPDGTELNDDASDQLQIFPSQLILRPGQVQTVRVRWNGEAALSTEQPFRVVAEQLPINLDRAGDEASGVRMMLRYRASLYVRPPEASQDVVVNDLTVSDERVSFTIENRGTAHAFLGEALLVILRNGERTEIRAEEIEVFTRINVLPGGTRQVSISREAFPVVPDGLSFRFEQ